MKKETVKLTRGAMQLVDDKCTASVRFAEGDGGEKVPQLSMTCYSGGIIKGHWYWGDLAIDLSGMSIPKKKIPILQEHMTDRFIAYATKFTKSNEEGLLVENATFVDTEESIKFRELSQQGFPFEASIYARPTQIQRLMENETAEVNGFTMKGPGTIWRKSTLKESSVCTFGYDSNTSSAAFGESEEVALEIEETSVASLSQKEEKTSMDITKLKNDHPEIYAEVFALGQADAQATFSAEKGELETKLSNALAANEKLSADKTDLEKRTLKLELAEEKRQAEAIKLSADNIFVGKFKESGLPERLSAKVRVLVSHDKFMADGKLDIEAFSAAVDAELKDWVGEGDGSVQGFSTSSKDHGASESEKLSKECDDAVDRMAKYLK